MPREPIFVTAVGPPQSPRFYNPSTLGYLIPVESERHHADLTIGRESAIAVASSADNGSRPSETAVAIPTDLAQAATDGDRRTNGTWWPLRRVVEKQTH
jgi:hypothetical protein